MSAGSFTSGVSASRPPLVHPRLHLAEGPLSDSIAASGLPVGLSIVEVTSMGRRGCVVPTISLSMLLVLTAIRRLTYVDLSVLPVSSPGGGGPAVSFPCHHRNQLFHRLLTVPSVAIIPPSVLRADSKAHSSAPYLFRRDAKPSIHPYLPPTCSYFDL